jgi:hypothetical protein
MLTRGPIEQQAVSNALELMTQAGLAYHATRPRPFGLLQAALRDAKSAGAICEEIALVLRTCTTEMMEPYPPQSPWNV